MKHEEQLFCFQYAMSGYVNECVSARKFDDGSSLQKSMSERRGNEGDEIFYLKVRERDMESE